MSQNERTFVVQCRTCNEDVVFAQAVGSINAEAETLRSTDLRCRKCGVSHVYTPREFVVCELDPA
jgi:hypothetical protein